MNSCVKGVVVVLWTEKWGYLVHYPQNLGLKKEIIIQKSFTTLIVIETSERVFKELTFL